MRQKVLKPREWGEAKREEEKSIGNCGGTKSKPREWGETKGEEERVEEIGARQKINQDNGGS